MFSNSTGYLLSRIRHYASGISSSPRDMVSTSLEIELAECYPINVDT